MLSRIFLFLLITTPLFAQEEIPHWFTDSNFVKNVNRWYQVSEYGEKTFHNALYVNPKKDFRLVAVFDSKALTGDAHWGLSWGREDAYSYYHFEINNHQEFQIGYRRDANYNVMEPWRSKKRIIRPDRNILEIRQIGGQLTFLINNKMVYKMTAIQFEYSGVAMRSSSNKVLFKRFSIYQDMGEVNLVEGKFEEKLVAKNLGEKVNSEYVDKSPTISPDGKTLYFIRENAKEGFGGQDIYYSNYQAGKGFNQAQNIGRPLNNRTNNFVNAVMPDNNTLMVVNSYRRGHTDEILAFTYRTPKGWSTPTPKRINRLQKLGRWVSFDLAADGKTIIFSMYRSDTYGGRDLYVSFLQPNGQFSPPRNLGPTINTSGNEHCPFLAADGKTLYFDTDGHAGYGGRDIFMAKRLDDSWTNWGKPKNLGPQINTEGADEGLVIPASGEYAYFVSEKESFGGLDIFRLKMPKNLRPEPTALVTGYVVDCIKQQGIPTSIRIYKKGKAAVHAYARTNPNNGQFKVALAGGSQYMIVAEYNEAKETTSHDTVHIDLTALDAYDEQEIDPICFRPKTFPPTVDTVPIRAQWLPSFESVYFEHDKYALTGEAKTTLDKMADTLKAYPSIYIEVRGHTDSNGSHDYNWTLAIRRSSAVIKYLATKGIERKRFDFKGFGETRPKATNATDKGRAVNRRVEFKAVQPKES